MFSQAIVHQDFGSVEERFASLTGGGRELSLSVVTQEEAMAALAHVQEDAAIEAEDALAQADEALVLG